MVCNSNYIKINKMRGHYKYIFNWTFFVVENVLDVKEFHGLFGNEQNRDLSHSTLPKSPLRTG